MIPVINASKIYSTLGNNSSLVPLAIKDIANSIGITTGSYITGDKLEGKDRFIDEFGTQGIWLFGLPVYKKLTDLTMYKMLKIDPKVDVRILKNKEILDKAIEYSPTEAIKKSIQGMKNHPKYSKNLAMAKFGIATVLTILSYAGLTKYRHKLTEEAARKEILAEQKNIQKKEAQTGGNLNIISHDIHHHNNITNAPTLNSFMGKKSTSKSTLKPTSKPTFEGGLQNFMFDPVKNLMIVDASITTERLTSARNIQDFVGYTIKEASMWGFMYFASKPIQKFLEKAAEQKHSKSIDLDARVIESDELSKAFKTKSIEKSLKEFPIGENVKDVDIYEFIHKKPNNFVVKMAKLSDVIPTLKDTEKIDTRAFVNIEDVKEVHSKLKKLYRQYNPEKDNLEAFLKQVKKLKRSSVLKNMGACVAALGVAVPAIMIALRFLDRNNRNFKVKEDLKKQMAFQGQIV